MTPFRRFARTAIACAWAIMILVVGSQSGLQIATDNRLDALLRTLGHASAFGILSLLVVRSISSRWPVQKSSLFGAWTITFLVAVLDEFHQRSVQGRIGDPIDVLVDMAGATVALTGIFLISTRRQERTKSPRIPSENLP